MIAPLYEYGTISEGTSFLVAIIAGIFFGFFLERGGLGDPHKLTGVFRLTDFAVPQAMFTAILVAASGLYLLSGLNLLDISKVWIVPTFFWPQIAGGLIFGAGFAVSGYCPGTAVAALATGRLDALVTMVGIGAGSLLFAIAYPVIEKFYLSSSLGALTLPAVFGMNRWLVLALVFVMAGVMFYLIERYGRKRSSGEAVQTDAKSHARA